MKTMNEKERFIELRAAGHSYESIAAQLGVSKQTLITWSRELQKEIANARALRLDALYEQYAVAKAKRIEILGERFQAIVRELDKRDLSEVPTVTLYKLALEYADRLKAEAEPVILMGDYTLKSRDPVLWDKWSA